ncbi:Armadillo repeat-containing protein 7 [Araneus ventricosus]|uniref:Armadillo repeat-containing protein 7 n=1 Tax=Araneus ventricosus TaxID=182803 RepID=A0A4Y2L4I8_ARAVE|nr:Armadillo repeat-containing protein 7 [Araneus ventricosus]
MANSFSNCLSIDLVKGPVSGIHRKIKKIPLLTPNVTKLSCGYNLEDENKNLVEFGIGGICNLCLDKNFKQLIYKRGGVPKVIKCLSSEREETVLSAITTLMFLIYPESKADITTASVIDCMLRFKESGNRRISNLASVFLQDYCTSDQIQNAKILSSTYSSSHASVSGT